MRARTFVVPATGLPVRVEMPVISCPIDAATFVQPVIDRLTAPTADTLLPQIVPLAPSGRAYQSHEINPPLGSTVQHDIWRIAADGMALFYGALTRLVGATSPAFAEPEVLEDWESDYGLPDPCLGPAPSLAARRQSVRAAFVAAEDQSRISLICLARQLGYEITVDEWEGLECGANGIGDEVCLGHPDLPHTIFISLTAQLLTWMECGATGLNEEGLGSFINDGLFCILRRMRQAHTQMIFSLNGVIL